MNGNSNCQDRRETIMALVLDELEAGAADELRRHIDTCRTCRDLYQALVDEEEMVRLGFDRIVERTKTAEATLAEQLDRQLGHRMISFGRVWGSLGTMRPITKLAAAVVVIIAALIGLNQFGGSFDGSSKVYAMSDVPELLGSAETLYMKGRIYLPPLEEDGESEVVDIEHWLDFENGRWRSTTPGTISGHDELKIILSERICDGGEFELILEHMEKQGSFSKLSQLQRKLRCRGLLETIMIFVCGDPKLFDLYKIAGEEELDGQTYNIWELSIEHEKMPDFKMQSWLSPVTGDFAQAIVWMKEGEKDWIKQLEVTSLKQNLIIPDSVFAMDVPDDYYLINTRETAPKRQIGSMSGGHGPYRLNMHTLFTLRDGTVIACWSSRNIDSQDSQVHLFADIEMGGGFPKLPFEVYALEASVNEKKEVFHGRHLCFTELEGKFYEWGIYVPAEKIEPRQSRVQSYSLIYRNHIEAEGAFRLATSADLLVKNKDDFETFVLGAMKEFSDQGEVGADITYEGVLQLAQQIRESLAE